MPANPNATNHDALRAIARGESPTWHQAQYCLSRGWATRRRLPSSKSGRTWAYQLTDDGRRVLG